MSATGRPSVLRLVFLIVFLLNRSSADASYSIAEIAIPAKDIAGVVINDFGSIGVTTALAVGNANNAIFRSAENEFFSLTTLGGQIHSIADINNSGLIIGSSQDESGFWRAIAFRDGGPVQLAFGEAEHSAAAGVNDLGTIVGDVRRGDSTRAVIFDEAGGFTELGTLGGNVSTATDVNNVGQVVGISLTGARYAQGGSSTPAQEGFLFEGGAMRGIGTLGGDTSNAYAINRYGLIVGESSTPAGEIHAFVYDSVRGMRDLGMAGMISAAKAINDHGVIVGYVMDSAAVRRAAVFEEGMPAAVLEELIPANSGWTRLIIATDIDRNGRIAGTGIYQGQMKGFVLTPIPEPSAWLLLVNGALSTSIQRRANRRTPLWRLFL